MLVTVFADASWCPKQQVAGWSAWARSTRGRTWAGEELRLVVPQAYLAEVCAVVRAVKMAVDAGVAQTGDTLLVQSDCRQVEAVLWQARFSEPGTERHRVETLASDVFRRLCERFELTCRFRHVKAHNGRADGRRSFLNERCDAVAKQHMRRARTRRPPDAP